MEKYYKSRNAGENTLRYFGREIHMLENFGGNTLTNIKEKKVVAKNWQDKLLEKSPASVTPDQTYLGDNRTCSVFNDMFKWALQTILCLTREIQKFCVRILIDESNKLLSIQTWRNH